MRRRYAFKKKIWLFLIGAIDAVGDLVMRVARCVFPAKTPLDWEKLRTADFEKILIIRLDHGGDVLLASPAVQALRQRFSRAKLCFLVGAWTFELVKHLQAVDDIITCSPPWFSRGQDRWSELKDLLPLLWRLRRERYDLGIELRGDIRHNLILWLANVTVRVGYGVAGGGFLLTHELGHDPTQHETESNLQLIRALGWEGMTPQVGFAIGQEETVQAFSLLSEYGISPTDEVLVIHPGGGSSWKQWPLERFAAIADWTRQRLGAKIVVIGSHEECDLTETVVAGSPDAINLAGRTTIPQLAAILKRSKVLVGNDSAPAHLAAAVGTPAVVLFHCASDPRRWRPLGDHVEVLHHAGLCNQYLKKNSSRSLHCLDAITIEEVKAAILKLWHL